MNTKKYTSTQIITLSLHDALPISDPESYFHHYARLSEEEAVATASRIWQEINYKNLKQNRSEEHTSELQSRENLVCRLLLEKKKKIHYLMEKHNIYTHYLNITHNN